MQVFLKKYIKIVVALLLFFGHTLISLPSAYAAAPIMHAYVAKLWLNKLGMLTQDHEAFYVGTLFPDARYLGNMKRKKTHFKNVSLSIVQLQPNSFYQGLKLHSWLDETREKFAVNYGVYKQLENIPKKYRASFLKFIEDELMFKKMDWQKVKSSLSNTYADQADFGADQKSLFIWHNLLKIYFSVPPSQSLSQLALFQMDLGEVPQDMIVFFSEQLPIYAKNPYFQAYTKNLVSHLEGKILEHT